MASNPYFAYSLKNEFLGETSSLSGTGLPDENQKSGPKNYRPSRQKHDNYVNNNINKNKRSTSRACDVCSIRKTKCDNSRPCRLCVANNVKCTELRVRKKSGPKTFRKKTIDSINSVGFDIASDHTHVALLHPSLLLVIQVLSGVPENVLDETVPFTVPEISAGAFPLIKSLETWPLVAGASVQTNVTRYAVTTFCLVLLEMLLLVNKPDAYDAMLRDLQVHILLIRAECERLLMFGLGLGLDLNLNLNLDLGNVCFDTHYHLALAELHQFSYLVLKAAPDNYKLVHLRAAVSHCDLLEPRSEENMYLKAELRHTLQLWERHMHLFGPDPGFRTVLMAAKTTGEIMTKTPFLNSYCDLLHVTDFFLESRHRLPEPFAWRHTPVDSGDSTLTYAALKLNLDTVSASGYLFQHSREHLHLRLLGVAIRFKVLLVCSPKLSPEYVSHEIMQIIVSFNQVLDAGPQLALFMEKFTFETVLLEVLAAYLSVVPEAEFTPEGLSELVQFTTTLSAYVSERSRRYLDMPQISGWFARFYGR